MTIVTFELPVPPSVNNYYGRFKNRVYIKHAGRDYRLAVQDIVAAAGKPMVTGRLAVFITWHPATKRKCDPDNILKGLLDAMTHSGVWEDDSMIDDLHIVRRDVIKGGKVRIVITRIGE